MYNIGEPLKRRTDNLSETAAKRWTKFRQRYDVNEGTIFVVHSFGKNPHQGKLLTPRGYLVDAEFSAYQKIYINPSLEDWM